MVGRTSAGRLGVATAAVAALTACGSAGAPPLTHRGDVVPVQAGSFTARDISQAQTAFGVDLLHEVCGRTVGENVLLSPTSAAEALSLLYPAAGGRTATDFGAVLHLPEWSPDLVAAVREHTQALDRLRYDGDPEDDDAPDSLHLSNRLWTALGLEPDPGYLDDIATAFDAEVQGLDFAGDPGGATDRINDTVSEDTHGLIEELFGAPLGSHTVAVLTNALHFEARWAVPFTDTWPAPFEAPSGEVTVDMMGGASGVTRSADGWQAVELPYRDGTLAAVAVLPPEGTGPCAVDVPTLAALDAAEPGRVGVRLPRMRIEQTHELIEPLEALGLPVAGDYSALGADGFISRVVQKTFLEVDEEGTVAAAATGVVVDASAGVPQPVVSFDRPFLFLLTDTETRSPLFVTVVNDPSA
ncbi:serpin family protein [Blastococcus mobilis]|uniref:Serpin B n=1 Tax=Blastococcus mobilis TaxID=1938746 RepID=A0A238YNC9_9ACTN|nr:serpin family protein [Blastococcus mobilis]SNR72154.1 serpin B [Blastococcus mobilis]